MHLYGVQLWLNDDITHARKKRKISSRELLSLANTMSLLKDLQKASRNESFFIDEEADASIDRIDPDDIDDFDFPLPTETSTQVVPAGFTPSLAPPGFVPQQIVRPMPGTQGPRQLDPTQYKQ